MQFENFEYHEVPYAEYPGLYDAMDVFVSPSRLEGGPISLLEAMMANAVPVATTTGFATDLIRDGVNGYLCPTNVVGDELCAAVERAFALEADVRATVEHLTWERFSRAIQALL
jgi:glycosyltransferase involved in cell wall biosynthesis